ncbi:hypothetical protein ACRARG_02205 [Pseudooceanicola sp. C21-150M6]|uniref:hypothetical protein n=1 Tax=Pseudooceanicola sp. C21-150M6 TaxID=3434355 RepID=UPI003D7FEDBE
MSGFVTVAELRSATDRYVAHPDYRAGQKQLADMSKVIGFEKNYAEFIILQAQKSGRLARSRTQTLCVYWAPTDIAMEYAKMFVRSWGNVHAVVPIIQAEESRALDLLGQPEASVEELLQAAR